MPGNIQSAFGLYNFFSKAIPGLVLLVGLAALAPSSWVGPLPRTITFRSLLFVFAAVLVGFVVGQVIHSLSSSTEKFLLRLRALPDAAETDKLTQFATALVAYLPRQLRRLIGYVSIAFEPIRYLDVFVTSSLTKQRDVFSATMEEFEDEREENFSYDLLLGQCDDLLNEGERIENERYSDLYLVLASHLESTGGRAKEFQSLYSFARSMWFVLFTISVVYTVFGVGFYDLQQTERVLVALFDTTQSYFVTATLSFLAGVVFLSDSGKYKSLYAQYLLADFHTATSASE